MDPTWLVEEHWCPMGSHWWECDLHDLPVAMARYSQHQCPFPLVVPCGLEEAKAKHDDA